MTGKKGELTYDDYVKGIKHLKPEEQLGLVEIISVQLKKKFWKAKSKYRITELEGLGADIWRGVDVEEYIRKERASWD